MTAEPPGLLGPAEIRQLAEELDVRPTKKLGQNFVHDANTVRRIVELAEVGLGTDTDPLVLEVGPGLGSLTLGLLGTGARVVAVEIDPALAGRLERTVVAHAPDAASRLTVVADDALRVDSGHVGEPDALVANLPYNVAVPVVLHLLAELPSLRRVLVMVQTEVADRMAAGPGGRVYGVPSVKLAWYGTVRKVAAVPRSVFWPVPNVDSSLIAFDRGPERTDVDRATVFAVVDAAFAQRRKTLRAALASWAGSAERAGEILTAAGIDPRSRGEQLDIDQYVAIARAAATM
ncbi:16S rRNA (adenine1518-N6/adenine1519-N6)-dimethyltransferase [Prauserella isguenensis]|uniref:Ribosomal RNA small subunit methyltransferase A n=1 Tax=Prauserella isguenensis TaxID=1470180 RepID=A0A839RZL1_9PSEU|nr:16S rRNA (adenine1518-N6/adenine1519-N6)-dimethyltransferase [Prauserella isguenensis]